NESIDAFYPLIDEIKLEADRPSPDFLKVRELMIRLDSSLIIHERQASKVPVQVAKKLAAMITQAK
ncbi:hypothetical protein SB780_41225, partial [Burkholderia sp. SIMBA_057]